MKTIRLILLLIYVLVLLPSIGNATNVLFNARVINNFFWRVKKDINPHAQGEFEITTNVFNDDKLGIGIIPFISHSFDDKAVDEGDWYVYLTYKNEKVDLRGGYIYYDVMGDQAEPQVRPEQGEVYASILFNGKFAGMKSYTGTRAFFDLEKAGAAYTETTISLDLGKPTSRLFLNLGTVTGFDFGQFIGNAKPQFTVMQIIASINFRIGEKVYFIPNYTYVLPLDADKFLQTEIWGVSLSFR